MNKIQTALFAVMMILLTVALYGALHSRHRDVCGPAVPGRHSGERCSMVVKPVTQKKAFFDAASVALLAKLGSIIVHVEEASGAGGHWVDWATVKSLVNDPEVQELLAGLRKTGLLPVKRR